MGGPIPSIDLYLVTMGFVVYATSVGLLNITVCPIKPYEEHVGKKIQAFYVGGAAANGLPARLS
jgi:hypothetical protein